MMKTREENRRAAKLRVWGYVITYPCPTCKAAPLKRCQDRRPDHEGPIQWPHPSRTEFAQEQAAQFILDNAKLWSPEFDDIAAEV